MEAISTFISGLHITGYGVVAVLLLLLLFYGLWRLGNREDSSFDWEDLICNTDIVTGKKTASVTKILQLTGGVAGTFVVIKLTLTNSLTWDIFVTYLAYVASIDGFSKYLMARYGVQNKDKDKEES
jgi:hypothetical protein